MFNRNKKKYMEFILSKTYIFKSVRNEKQAFKHNYDETFYYCRKYRLHRKFVNVLLFNVTLFNS